MSPRWLQASSQRGPSVPWGRKPALACLGLRWSRSVSDRTDSSCPSAGFLPVCRPPFRSRHWSRSVPRGLSLSVSLRPVTWICSRAYASGPFVCWPPSPSLPELFPSQTVPEPESPRCLRSPETSLLVLSGRFAHVTPAWRPRSEPFLAVGLWPRDVAFSAPSPSERLAAHFRSQSRPVLLCPSAVKPTTSGR